MALVKIKGIKDPFDVIGPQAAELKKLRFAEGGDMTQPVEFGGWAGEIGKIEWINTSVQSVLEEKKEKRAHYIIYDRKMNALVCEPLADLEEAKRRAQKCREEGRDVVLEKRIV